MLPVSILVPVEVRCTWSFPSSNHNVTQAMEFIDRGDDCNDPPESIGNYDLDDDFIDDESIDEEEVPNNQAPMSNMQLALVRPTPDVLQEDLMCPLPEPPREVQPVQAQSCLFLSDGESDEPVRTGGRVSRHNPGNNPAIDRNRGQNGVRHRRPARRERSRERELLGPRRGRGRGRGRGGKNPNAQRQRRTQGVSLALAGPASDGSGGAEPTRGPLSMEDAVAECTHMPGTRLGRPGSFRLSCRRVFLTYSQVPDGWNPQSLLDRLEELGAKYRVARELHQDGGIHYHAYVDFVNKRDFGRANYFDIDEHHPNIRSIWKTPEFVFDYVGKDGDIVASTVERPDPNKGASARQEAWGPVHALERAEEIYEAISKIDPRAAILSYPAISQFMERKEGQFRRSKIRAHEDAPGLVVNWEAYPELRHWVLGSLPNGASRIRRLSGPNWEYTRELEASDRLLVPRRVRGGRVKSLILWGPTQLGKTIAARSFGRHGYMCLNFNLEKILNMDIDTLEYVLWDDISWNSSGLNQDQYKGWFGCQKELDVSDKYMKKHTITWGKPVVFNTNHNPEFGISHVDMDWLNGNCITIAVREEVPIATCDMVYETEEEEQ